MRKVKRLRDVQLVITKKHSNVQLAKISKFKSMICQVGRLSCHTTIFHATSWDALWRMKFLCISTTIREKELKVMILASIMKNMWNSKEEVKPQAFTLKMKFLLLTWMFVKSVSQKHHASAISMLTNSNYILLMTLTTDLNYLSCKLTPCLILGESIKELYQSSQVIK